MSGSRADQKSKKITNFEVSSSLILHIEPFLYQWILYDKSVDFIRQMVMTSSVTEPERSSNALPKGKPALQKGHGHWWFAAGLIHYCFLSSGETTTSEKYAQQIDEVH